MQYICAATCRGAKEAARCCGRRRKNARPQRNLEVTVARKSDVAYKRKRKTQEPGAVCWREREARETIVGVKAQTRKYEWIARSTSAVVKTSESNPAHIGASEIRGNLPQSRGADVKGKGSNAIRARSVNARGSIAIYRPQACKRIGI